MISRSLRVRSGTAIAISAVRDFLGQEVVWRERACVGDELLWLHQPSGADRRRPRGRHPNKAALSAMYAEGRFLGGFEWTGPHGVYRDSSTGDIAHFHGREIITVRGVEAYSLDYFGGLVKP